MKKLAFILSMSLLLGVLTSCGSSLTVASGKEMAPYGVDARFIGCWVEKVEEGEAKEIMQFLPNGKVYSKIVGAREDLTLGVWYTSEENILTFEGGNSLYFEDWQHTNCLVKYAFIDDNTFTISAGGTIYKFVRITEHFADIAY